MSNQVKVGDIVTGLEPSPYRITKAPFRMKVLEFSDYNTRIMKVIMLEGAYKGREEWVEIEHFTLIEPKIPTKGLAYQVYLQEQLQNQL